MSNVGNPIDLLHQDREHARLLNDPMVDLASIATINKHGEPQCRTLVLRTIKNRLAIFVNQTSSKYQEFKLSKTIAVMVYLPSLSVQYRLTCKLSKIDPEIVRHHWNLRPEISKQLDWLYETYPQSSQIESNELLQMLLLKIPQSQQAPDSAVGFYLDVCRVEQLQLKTQREVSHRLLFSLQDHGSWNAGYIVP